MAEKAEKFVTARVPADLKHRLDIYLATESISMRDYLIKLITEDLNKNSNKGDN